MKDDEPDELIAEAEAMQARLFHVFPQLAEYERALIHSLHTLTRAAILGVNTNREELLPSQVGDLEAALSQVEPTLVDVRSLVESSGLLEKLNAAQRAEFETLTTVKFKE